MPITKHVLLTLSIAFGLYSFIWLINSFIAWHWLVYWPDEMTSGLRALALLYYLGCAILAAGLRHERIRYKNSKELKHETKIH